MILRTSLKGIPTKKETKMLIYDEQGCSSASKCMDARDQALANFEIGSSIYILAEIKTRKNGNRRAEVLNLNQMVYCSV